MKIVNSKQYIVDRWLTIFVLTSLLSTVYYLLPTAPAFAQGTPYTLLQPIPLDKSGCTGNETGDQVCETTPGPYIEGIFTLIIAIAGGLAVIMLIYGGIKYMSTDAIGGKSEAKDTIQNALWGLLLVISAWLILSTINEKLVTFDLKILDPVTQTP